MPMVESTKFKSPLKIGSNGQAMNVESESAMLPDWVNTYFTKKQKIMGKISKEALTFNDFPVTVQDENYGKDDKKLKI